MLVRTLMSGTVSNNMVLHGPLVLFTLYFIRCGLCTVQRDRTLFTKLSLLEEEISAMKRSIQRNEESRKTDLQILRHDMNIRLESLAVEELSVIIDDKVKAGQIRGVVDGSVNTLLQHQQRQIQQLKGYIKSDTNRQPQLLSAPKKPAESFGKLNKRLRTMVKRLKRYEAQIKELKDEILDQNLQIMEFKADISKQIKMYEELRRKREQSLTEYRPGETSPKPKLSEDPTTTRIVPSFSTANLTQTVDVGSMVELECVVTGNPKPVVEWTKVNGPLPVSSFVDADNVLVIKNVRQEDQGSYRCLAINSHGSAQTTVKLLVTDHGIGRTAVACAGSTAVLRCSYSKANAAVGWKDMNKQLLAFKTRVYSSDRRLSVQRPYTSEWNLHIKSVKSTDEGEYECFVGGKPFKSKVTLKVKSC